jgi:hypothetical protein
LSPQTRRGRAATPSHRKPAAQVPPAAGRKPVPQVEGVAKQSDEVAPVPAKTKVKPIVPKHEAKPVRRKGTLANVKKSSAAKYGGEWVRAYLPLFAVAILGFFALWAWISFGPHTPSPKENFTRIEEAWKPKRDADLQKVAAAAAGTDLTAQLAAYKSLSTDTAGWMKELAAVTTWEDPNAPTAAGQSTTATQAMATFTADGQAEATALASMLSATTPNDILAGKDVLLADEQAFTQDYVTARTIIVGSAQPAASSLPTLAFPPGTFVPSASPGASGSAGPSPASSASATPEPSPTPAPTVSTTPT